MRLTRTRRPLPAPVTVGAGDRPSGPPPAGPPPSAPVRANGHPAPPPAPVLAPPAPAVAPPPRAEALSPLPTDGDTLLPADGPPAHTARPVAARPLPPPPVPAPPGPVAPVAPPTAVGPAPAPLPPLPPGAAARIPAPPAAADPGPELAAPPPGRERRRQTIEPRVERRRHKRDERSRGWMPVVARRGSDKAAPPEAAPPEPEPPQPPVAVTPPAGVEAADPADRDGAPRHSGRPLGELLVGRGLVSEDQLREALMAQTGSGMRLGNVLVELGLLDERALTGALAEQLGLDVMDLGRVDIDPEVVALLPEEEARRLGAIPVRRAGARIEVVVADPLSPDLDLQLVELMGSLIQLRLAVRSDIEHAIDRCYAPAAELGDALRTFEAQREARRATQVVEQAVQTVVDENAPVVKIVNVLLEQAVRDRASDVHIEPMAGTVRVRVRTDGALHQITTLPGPMGPSLVSRIKVMSDMNIVERRRPQDGQMAVSVAGRDLDVRVSTTPTAFGEKCVLRILDKSRAVIELPALGMEPATYERFSDLIRSPYGMIICAGPTGSGKTTTLYAALTAINKDEINLVTIEDPVEYVFPTINQIQVNEPAGLTFASCLRSVLRQDPDAILVGEIRDVETARIATQAALTGHFVMSSLHATDATSALHRFMDMGIEPFLVASSLLGIVGQRLIRRVCEHCAEPYTPTPEELSFYERGGGEPGRTVFTHGAGCNFCGHTGYFDRVGIYEVLSVTDEMKELIVTNAPHAQLRALAIQQGMTTIRDQAIRLASAGETTIAEVIRTVYVL